MSVERPGVGLCESCAHVRRIVSARGSEFILCGRAASDASFPKYPRLPVLACRGFQPATGSG